MSAPCYSVCSPWCSTSDMPADCTVTDEVLLDRWIAVASDVLFALSGSQFPGICSDVVRPDKGSRVYERGCLVGNMLDLGLKPLVDVTQVKIDGSVLDSSRYRVDDYRYLVRLPDVTGGPSVSWPTSQRFDRTSDETETFEVTAVYGRMPPPAGVRAAAQMACELAKAASGGDCKLPERVTRVARQGVDVDIEGLVLDPFAFFDSGRTGIYEVDTFLASVNPHGARRRAVAIDPARPRRVRRVAT